VSCTGSEQVRNAYRATARLHPGAAEATAEISASALLETTEACSGRVGCGGTLLQPEPSRPYSRTRRLSIQSSGGGRGDGGPGGRRHAADRKRGRLVVLVAALRLVRWSGLRDDARPARAGAVPRPQRAGRAFSRAGAPAAPASGGGAGRAGADRGVRRGFPPVPGRGRVLDHAFSRAGPTPRPRKPGSN
jgi:hypothetical protein